VQFLRTASSHQTPACSHSWPFPLLSLRFRPRHCLPLASLICIPSLRADACTHALRGGRECRQRSRTKGCDLDAGQILRSRVLALVGLGLLNEAGVGVDQPLDLRQTGRAQLAVIRVAQRAAQRTPAARAPGDANPGEPEKREDTATFSTRLSVAPPGNGMLPRASVFKNARTLRAGESGAPETRPPPRAPPAC